MSVSTGVFAHNGLYQLNTANPILTTQIITTATATSATSKLSSVALISGTIVGALLVIAFMGMVLGRWVVKRKSERGSRREMGRLVEEESMVKMIEPENPSWM